MPSLSRVRSPEPGAAILIAAPSGRALAAAARRAGYRPLVADFFDDSDTRGFCAANRLVEGGLEAGFNAESLIGALEALRMVAKGGDDRVIGKLSTEVAGVRPPVEPAGLRVVHVGIDQPWRHEFARDVDASGGGWHLALHGRSRARDAPVFEHHDGVGNGADARVD